MYEEEIASIKNRLQPVSTILYALKKRDKISEDFLKEAEDGLNDVVKILNKMQKEIE